MPGLEKPKVGEPCNGCGVCCQAQVCSLGSFTLGLVSAYGERAPGPCPVLLQDGEVYTCGLVARPRDYAPGNGGAHDLREAAKVMIGAGAGCDEPGPGEDGASVELSRRYLERIGARAINRAVAKWFGV